MVESAGMVQGCQLASQHTHHNEPGRMVEPNRATTKPRHSAAKASDPRQPLKATRPRQGKRTRSRAGPRGSPRYSARFLA